MVKKSTKTKASLQYVEEEAPVKATRFEKFCHWAGKTFKNFGKGRKLGEQYIEAFDFLGWNIKAEEFMAGMAAVIVLGLVFSFIAFFFLFFMFNIGLLPISDFNIFLLLGMSPFIATVVAVLFFQRYPLAAVAKEQAQSLAYIPEIVNYLTMSMRLTPNLERAVQFAAEHGQGKIADEFKKLLWDVQIGRYLSVEEGLDQIAYRWGKFSEEFKHALMLIRASILEIDETKRTDILEKAIHDVLEASKEKMDMYARKMNQPAVYLYYFGILLPLLLAIMLPISSMFLNLPLAKIEYLVLAYNIGIPLVVFLYGKNIIAGRPPTYIPPAIPANYPGLKKGRMLIGTISLPALPIGIVALIALSFLGYTLEQARIAAIPSYIATKEIDFTPYLWILLTFVGIAIFISTYLLGKYQARKKVQNEIREMEVEFKDAMYVLASRLGENRPIEDALKHASDFMPKSKIANTVFTTIVENITTLGMTLEGAIFDPVFGALHNLPSRIIRSGMRVVVDAVELGVQVAARSLIALSIQIRDAQKIDESLKKMLEDVTTMLKTMSIFVAPIVLGVVASMQRLITSALSGLATGPAAEAGNLQNTGVAGTTAFSGGAFSGLFGHAVQSVSAGQFILVMGIYVMEITILLSYFNSQIEDARNNLHTYVSIAKALPIATILFAIVAYFAGGAFTIPGA